MRADSSTPDVHATVSKSPAGHTGGGGGGGGGCCYNQFGANGGSGGGGEFYYFDNTLITNNTISVTVGGGGSGGAAGYSNGPIDQPSINGNYGFPGQNGQKSRIYFQTSEYIQSRGGYGGDGAPTTNNATPRTDAANKPQGYVGNTNKTSISGNYTGLTINVVGRGGGGGGGASNNTGTGTGAAGGEAKGGYALIFIKP